MMTPKDLYLKLKQRAKRLLLKGDLEHYMRTLRRMHEIRSTMTRPAV